MENGPDNPALANAVVGVFDRERLSAALAATHRAGFGPHARVLDGGRGDLSGQLRRAGLHVPLGPTDGEATTALIVVTAPGRGAAVAEVLTRAGARAVHAATRDAQSVAAPPIASMPVSPATPAPAPADETRP